MSTRLTLPMMSILVVAMLAACSESPPPSPEPTVAPTVAPTSTPVPTPSPTPVVPFEDSLSSADLARFQALPVESPGGAGRRVAGERQRQRPPVSARHAGRSCAPLGDTRSGNSVAIGHNRRAVPPPASARRVSQFDSVRHCEKINGWPETLADLEYKYGKFDNAGPRSSQDTDRGRPPCCRHSKRALSAFRPQEIRVARSSTAGVVPPRLGDYTVALYERRRE